MHPAAVCDGFFRVSTAMARNKNGCTFSKGASCSCAFDTRGPRTVTLDLKNGTATSYMEGANGMCQRALLFLHPEAPRFALRGFVLIRLFLWKYRACIQTAWHVVNAKLCIVELWQVCASACSAGSVLITNMRDVQERL